MYIELHTSSAFSFLRAASTPETIVERAALLGYPAVALLDRDGVSGAPRFHKAALAAGLRPLIGAELTLVTCPDPGSRPALSGVEGIPTSNKRQLCANERAQAGSQRRFMKAGRARDAVAIE